MEHANISQDEFRAEVRGVLALPGMTINKLAASAGVDWAVLKRFTAADSTAGISLATAEKLWPFVYGDKRPAPKPQELPQEAA